MDRPSDTLERHERGRARGPRPTPRRQPMTAFPYSTALVTGASRGIGAAISRRLVAGGLTVFGVARSAEDLEALRSDLGDGFRPLPGDILNAAAIVEAIGEAEIDVLVNNAGGLS